MSKKKLSLEERWEADDVSYKTFLCNTCKYFKGYPSCEIHGLIPDDIMDMKKICKDYEKGGRK